MLCHDFQVLGFAVGIAVEHLRTAPKLQKSQLLAVQEGDGVVPDFEDRNPNPMKFVGSQQVGIACGLGLASQLAIGADGGCPDCVSVSGTW